MATGTLKLKTYKQEGDLGTEYNPLRNVLDDTNQIVDFNVDADSLGIDLNNPLNIECQPSYDGTVNLIINDDKNPPRIINTRFTKIEDNKYKIINRNQLEQTNLYKKSKIDQQTRLFRNINTIPKFDLMNVFNSGQLLGGNYIFYAKFADNDYNKTDIVAESAPISIFKGYLDKIHSIQGALVDEKTDKAVTIRISNIDTSFQKIYLYFTRDTCDENGIRITKAYELTTPYEIKNTSEIITINGYEEIKEISIEELNIKYNLVTAAKTQAQVQNMLFFGNVQGITVNIKDLQNISYFIKVTLKQRDQSIGWISAEDYKQKEGENIDQTEYYSPNNIYYNLGYWPDEMYRLGIVYIMNDDSLSPVFNLRGCNFTALNQYNFNPATNPLYTDGKMNYLVRDDFLADGNYLDNSFGVFKNPNIDIIDYTNNQVKPLYYQMDLSNEVLQALPNYKVKGFFFVRQKRIPTTLCQGLSVGVDSSSYVPMLYWNTNSDSSKNNKYIVESFLNESKTLVQTFEPHLKYTTKKQGSGLLSVDANCIKTLQSNFDGTEFILKPNRAVGTLNNSARHFWVSPTGERPNVQVHASLSYVPSEVPLKYINGYGYSTKAGTQEDVSQFSFFDNREYSADNTNLIRGNFCPFIGVGTSLYDNVIYDVKIPNYTESQLKNYFSIRGKDNSIFYAISDRFDLNTTSIDVYRGDCYTSTVTIRMNRNFIDSEVPLNDTIIDPNTWKTNYKGYMNMVNDDDSKDETKGNFTYINRADINTVNLGMWVTFKCLSNYNLGLRSNDTSYIDENALMGSPRSFYPATDMSVVVSHKIEESWLLNDGYDSTLGQRRNFIADNVPYIKELFDNRVMFSDVQNDDDFRNAYRIFQGLDYKDIDRQYGSIVKLLPFGVNLFCVFEHGLGIIPINEKALIQTNTGQSIHMYGAGVLQNQITLISPDFGSIWQESVIRTPMGIYGVDTYAKKIWRYSENKGLECISDMKVQSFLNQFVKFKETDKYPTIAIKNVKSHFNNYKGDVMFTFYNYAQNTVWNLCYNERMDRWITRYSWTPLYSENINNIFYSLDRNRAEVLAHVYDNKHCTYGIRTTDSLWSIPKTSFLNSTFSTTLSMEGSPFDYNFAIETIKFAYLNEYDVEKEITLDDSTDIANLFTISNGVLTSATYGNARTWFRNKYGKTGFIPVFPAYFIIRIAATITGTTSTTYDTIGIIIDNKSLIDGSDDSVYVKQQRSFLQNGFYVHGRAGIFNEMKYEDASFDNQILPTKWYEKQEPFEFEFVVNDDVGTHKIFDNLVIISNNVQPNEIEYEIIGDVYNFNKAGIFRNAAFGEGIWNKNRQSTKPGVIIPEPQGDGANIQQTYATSQFYGDITEPRGNSNFVIIKNKKYKCTQEFYNCRVKWDTTLNSYSLVTTQPCKNISLFGRRLGNIQYKEDAWYVTIDPIKYRERFNTENVEEPTFYGKVKEARQRDKFIKIRVKYTGEDLVIITALKTILTQSFA